VFQVIIKNHNGYIVVSLIIFFLAFKVKVYVFIYIYIYMCVFNACEIYQPQIALKQINIIKNVLLKVYIFFIPISNNNNNKIIIT